MTAGIGLNDAQPNCLSVRVAARHSAAMFVLVLRNYVPLSRGSGPRSEEAARWLRLPPVSSHPAFAGVGLRRPRAWVSRRQSQQITERVGRPCPGSPKVVEKAPAPAIREGGGLIAELSSYRRQVHRSHHFCSEATPCVFFGRAGLSPVAMDSYAKDGQSRKHRASLVRIQGSNPTEAPETESTRVRLRPSSVRERRLARQTQASGR